MMSIMVYICALCLLPWCNNKSNTNRGTPNKPTKTRFIRFCEHDVLKSIRCDREKVISSAEHTLNLPRCLFDGPGFSAQSERRVDAGLVSIAPAHLDRQFLCHIAASFLELVHESSTNPNSLRERNFSPSLLCFRRFFDRSTKLIRGWISARDVRLLRVRDYGRLRLAHCGRSADQQIRKRWKVARPLVGRGEEQRRRAKYTCL